MTEPTIYVDITKMKEHCNPQFIEYGNCLQKYTGEQQQRMCSVERKKLEACSEHYVGQVKQAVVRCSTEIQKFTNECSHLLDSTPHCNALQEAVTTCSTKDIKPYNP